MIDRLNALAAGLERMNALYLRCLDLFEIERQALIVFDYETFYATMRDKDEILATIRALDRDRLRIQDQFATLNDVHPDEVSLKFIGQSLIADGGAGEEIGLRLLAHRERLANTVETLRQKIERNRGFIERSVQNLRGIAENLAATLTGKPGAATRGSNVYTGKARYEENKNHAGGILSRRL